MDERGRQTGKPARGHGHRVWHLTCLVLALGLITTSTMTGWLRAKDQQRARDEFTQAATQASTAMAQYLQTYFERLRSVGAFIASRKTVTSEELSTYLARDRTFADLRSLQGIEFIRRVPEDRIDEFVAEQAAAHPGFMIDGRMDHPPGSAYYIVSAYAPGAVDFQLPLGADLSGLPTVRALVDASAGADSAVIANNQRDPILLQIAANAANDLVDKLLRLDFHIGIPVFDTSGEVGLDHLVGWVGAPVGRFSEVLDAAASNRPASLGMSLAVDVHMPELPGDTTFTRVTARTHDTPDEQPDSLTHDQTVTIMGIPFELHVWSTASVSEPTSTYITLAGGVSTTVLAAAFVTQRRRNALRRRSFQVELDRRSALEHDLVESVRAAVVVLDGRSHVVMGNAAWVRLRRPVDAGDYLTQLAPAGDGVGELARALDSVLTGDEASAEVTVVIDRADERRWYSVRVTPLSEAATGAVAMHTDITKERRTQEKLAEHANSDPLTGLLNRRGLELALDELVERTNRDHTTVAMLFIDLDGFKQVNDTLGHAVGDEVLTAVADAIRQSVRAGEIAGRLGGDEFVVALGRATREQAESIAHRLLARLSHPLPVSGGHLTIGASIGIALATGSPSLTRTALISRADRAMYHAKHDRGTHPKPYLARMG